MNPILSNTKNYLVPSSGNTHAVTFTGIFSAAALPIDWRQFAIDNYPFQPQGVFIDNSLGIAPLVINFQPINYNVTCPAGVSAQFQFPAVDNQTCSITGSGQASVNFVDFPVLPNAGMTNIANTVPVTISGPNPVFVQENPLSLTAPIYASITGAGVTAALAPVANTNLRKLIISLSDNASLAVAGTDLLTVTLNGVIIFKLNIYIPGAAGTVVGYVPIELNFDMLGLNVGAGNLTVALATALATGILDINAYFG